MEGKSFKGLSQSVKSPRWKYFYIHQNKQRVFTVLSLIGATALFFVFLIYQAGGTKHLNPGLLLLPILAGAFYFGPLVGVVLALLLGFMVGPWMPLSSGQEQTGADWSLRILFYGFSSILVGVLSARFHKDLSSELERHSLLLEEANARIKETPKIIQQERLRSLGQMASGIVHDLNNILTPAVGYSDLLLKKSGEDGSLDKIRPYLQHIETALHDAVEVISRLQEFYNQSDKGGVFLPVKINRLIEQAISITEPSWKAQAQKRGRIVKVTTSFTEEMEIRGNEADLRTILINLLLNAIDAMPEGGQIAFKTRKKEEYGLLEVSDTGVGMSPETLEKCREPFFSTKGRKGTGLGLSIIWDIVDLHGGKIEVKSQEGEGTTFILSFPLYQGSEKRVVAQTLPSPTKSYYVLVVDDNKAVRNLVVETLEDNGHRAKAIANPRRALQVFEEEEFDVILSDVAMSEMNGYELARAIREKSPETPVILLTGFSFVENELPHEIDAILEKPFRSEELCRAIYEACKKK